MMFALGATFKIFSTIISETAANQISFQLRDEYSKEVQQGKIKAEFTDELVKSIISLGKNIERSDGNVEYKSEDETIGNIIHL